ncbi:MAG: cache domain-containing protein [Hydrogenophaga sp.]|uniref:sensor histidine kinase n=1 Tax=Hydrogenophaga sp. TaxID=1904254 RepID=UPI0027285EFD|nr:cache domain-containing protein [Hydrogenophaga sp.]MDO9199869.1 cache domain-containing protein [Hydrogenophaga sp.]MDO9481587.1 cache domain-containing protein [Hydrogenophaga sp.]MDP2221549.1 cache domain-containing protein [Hydrogenophaga sp.]MDP3345362.1 cache domain-containing protein [Hydrogenophaga sp.]MDP3806448.1 cache domain-containing protein [Hydrogenophaga sp.]
MKRYTPRWLAASVRNKLLAMALLPLLVVFPLLVLAMAVWSHITYDRLLITKVRSDLAVARGYFDQVLIEVGSGTRGVAGSQRLLGALPTAGRNAPATPAQDTLRQRLDEARQELRLDFLLIYGTDGRVLASADGVPPHAALPADLRGLVPEATQAGAARAARLMRLDAASIAGMAPQLLPRLRIPLVSTRNAAPDTRRQEDRAMVVVSMQAVRDASGQVVALLAGGLLLNQNLDFIDHINRIVYPEGSLPFGSEGTATLFLDDVRITTNVRLFQDQRAIGTRVSQTVRERVLEQGQTWLDRAFVVNDWYVSAYDPLLDAAGQRIGMLYVGYLESPFRLVRLAMIGVMGLIFLAVMALSAWFSVRWARSIFQPVERMNGTMQRVEDGQSNARVGALPARDELGALAAHLDQLLDVIDDKTRTLQRWGEELDHKVAERTRELEASNASLQLAQQQLVKSEKLAAIGQLTASIAHEINNPIAVMQGNLDLIRETLGEHSQPVRAELRLLDEQVERMRLIVTQLLQYARPTEYAGYVETLDLNRTVDDCLVLVAHLLAQTRIEVQRCLQATQRVGFNRQELQQVIINLLINALQAMPQGGVLRLETRDWVFSEGDTPKPGALLCVLDSGTGLAPGVQERLFRPFFTTKNDGNGLGLWISQGLLERYGGRLEASNRSDGPGAAFTVKLLTEPQAPAAVNTRDGRPGG